MDSRDQELRLPPMRQRPLSRRQLLRLTAGAVAGTSLAAVLAACGGGSESTPTTSAGGTTPTAAGGATTPSGGGATPSGGTPSAGGKLPEGAPFTIGVSNGFVGSEWRTQMIQDLQAVNADYMKAGLTKELVIESADTDVQGQIQQIRNLMNRGVNAIIVNPNSQTGLNAVIQEATDAGIVVIAVDQEISAPGAINVVIDQTEWARMSARWLAEQLGGKGKIVIVNGIAGHPANEARYNGVKEVLSQYPDIEVLNVVNANWDQATGQQKMSDLLASQPQIDGVWTQDGMALGVLQAIQAANPAKWPIVVGEARAGYMQLWHQIKQSRPDFVSYGVINPPGIGASGLRVAVELLSGKELKDDALKGPFKNSLYVPIPGVVDESNFDEEYQKIANQPASYVLDGIASPEEIAAFFK
ncbi:MAG: substrate-binding domain-containing protein [Sphaerobacter sp.]|nr:substrate-binding domain-containing protein [Sphaerobacter sp.]